MIRKAIGLGILFLTLRFLMKAVFLAFEDTTIQMLNTASVLFSNVGSMQQGINVANLIPQ